MNMQMSENGKNFLKGWEVLKQTGYDDGYGNATAGWGHTGDDVSIGVTYTTDQCNRWFDDDTQKDEDCVNSRVTFPINQNMFDALCSFVHNVGCGAFSNSTLLKLINSGDLAAGDDQFDRWVRAAGEISRGLERRREAEATLFLTPYG
jgi:lysozyme